MKGRVPSLAPRQVIRALTRGGFYIHHIVGSHYTLRHSTRERIRVTIAFHNKELKRGTLQSITTQSGLTAKEFLDLL